MRLPSRILRALCNMGSIFERPAASKKPGEKKLPVPIDTIDAIPVGINRFGRPTSSETVMTTEKERHTPAAKAVAPISAKSE
mmetsp:Transcript_62501/g.191174  ORF Transcript_62501/g.191174 Transcript_62501/m.191174 type:complete len:82 (-) Transcript_62501:1536-1781(-)